MSTNTYDWGADPMKSAIRYLILILIGLILGLPLGIRFGHRSFDRGNEIFSDVLALSEYETLRSSRTTPDLPLATSYSDALR